MELWYSEKITALRKAELTGEYSIFGDSLPCKTCTSCQPLSGNRVTSEHQLRQLTGTSI